MPESHRITIQRYMDEVWNQGNLAVIDEIFTKDSHFLAPHSAEFHDLNSRKDFVAGLRTAFPDLHYDVIEILTEEDAAALRFTFRGTHEGGWLGASPRHQSVHTSGTTMFHFQGDKIVEELVQWDALGYMEQLGLVTMRDESAQEPVDV